MQCTFIMSGPSGAGDEIVRHQPYRQESLGLRPFTARGVHSIRESKNTSKGANFGTMAA